MTVREELAQEWRERLQDFAESEMTVQVWCNFNRVSLLQYYYWRRRLLAADTQKAYQRALDGCLGGTAHWRTKITGKRR